MPDSIPMDELCLWVVGGIILAFALASLLDKLKGL